VLTKPPVDMEILEFNELTAQETRRNQVGDIS